MESNGDISTPSGKQGEEKASGRTAGGGGSLEKLSQEELITKCRSLLTLAQKAKAAKDEIALELKQAKIAAKNAAAAEIPQKVEEESNALREMVANLTEGKVALTTKIESLQRQLKVTSSEVDCLQVIEQKLMHERNSLEAENIHLKKENQKNLDKLREFQDSSAAKSEILEKAWETEKITLQEKVENLQAQIGQVDILKTKCKKFLQEKSAIEKELEKQQKLAVKGIKIQGELNSLKEEKKASDIILESSRKDKKDLEDKVKSLESQVQSLKKVKEEGDASLKLKQDRIQELEIKLKKNDSLVLEDYFKELQEQNEKVQLEKKVLRNTNTKLQTEYEAAILQVNTLQEKVKVEYDKSRSLGEFVEKLKTTTTQQLADCKREVECLKVNFLENENHYKKKDIELQKLIEEKNDTERSMQEEIWHLKSKEELLEQEKKHNEVRLEQFCIALENLKMELSTMTENSNIVEKEKTHLTEKLKAQEEETRKLIEHLKQKDNEHVDLIENKAKFDNLIAQVNKLNFEVEQLTEEKNKYLKNTVDVENEIACLRKNLEDAQKEKSSFDTELCKFVSEVEQSKTAVEEERKRADHLTADIKELKSQNTELIATVEQLQGEAENTKAFLGKLQNTGMCITSLCQQIYPTLSNTLLPVDQEDVLARIQSIQEVLAEALTRRENFTPEEDVLNIVKALEQVQEQNESLIMSRDCAVCDSLSSSFDNISKNLMTFCIHAVGMLDIEKSTSVEEMCKVISAVFANLCEIIKEEMLKLNNATSTVEELRKKVNHYENLAAEVVKEREMLSQKLMDSLNQNAIIITEKNEQLENHNNIIAEYEKSQKQLNQSIEEEKFTLNKKISSLEAMVLSSDTIRAELEGLLTSRDSQKKGIVNDLRQQLNTVKEECKVMSQKCEESASETKNLQELLKKKDEDFLNLSTEKEVLVSEKLVIKQENDFLKSTVEDFEGKNAADEIRWLHEKEDLEKKLARISEEKIMLEKKYSSQNESKILVEENAAQENAVLKEKLNSIIKEQETQMQETVDIRSENVLIMEKVQELQLKKEDLIEEVNKFQNYLKAAEDKIQSLINEKEDFEKKLKDADNHKLQLNSSIEASTGRCEELLAELNDMNKVLRERGERISRLEDTNKEKSQELEKTTIQLKELQTKMSNREAELASKQEQLQTITEKLQSFSSDSTVTSPINNRQIHELDEKVKDLEQERTNLMKTIQSLESELSLSRENGGCGHDAQSEVMSTSTIGRAEDTQRMKELEDTFEERYMKLKSVAIKLKKRVAELTAQLNSSEETRNKLATEKEDLKKKVDVGVKDSMKAASKNIQALQGEIDRLQDEVDSKAKELKEQGKQLNLAAEQFAAAKSDLGIAQDENEILHRTVKNLEETISSQEDAAGSLRGQITSLEKRLAAELQKQQTLEDRRKKAEERMEEERQRAAQFIKELEEAKQDSKTRSLLDLEMRDYELTLEELNGQLREKDSCIAELQAALEREKGRSSSLQDQLTHLTTQETTERERADKMKKLLLEHKTQLAELHLAQEAQSTAKEMDRVTIEHLTQEVEKLKLAIAELTCEKIKLEDSLNRSKLSSERQIEVLEDQLMKHKIEVQQLVAERDAVRNEFEGYKVRATSVLRQKNRPPEVNVSELQSEKDQLQTDCESAQLKVQQLQSELSALRAENSYIQSEKDGIARQVSSLSEELNRRESSHHEKITILESKMEGKMTEYQRIIASMSNQNEAMSNNFKKQLDTLKQTHSREVEQLTSKLEESEDKLWQLKNTISNSIPATASSVGTTLATTCSAPNLVHSESDHSMPGLSHSNTQQHRRQLSHGCDDPRIDVTNMVREEGEGSEWVEPVHRSPGKQRGYSPPPLEQLINSPLTSQDDNVSIASINIDATGKEVARLEAKLNAGEMRIQQLTTLLHESEAENAKLAQLSDALKEEIRRSVRNELREKHMENMEYMKNVILKFLVLKHGEERKHLVPVLKTVLQLSPTETSQLELLALGDEGDGGSQAGWGNYLHLWSSR